METCKVWCKCALFLLHFLIYCNACQIEMRGLKSCGIQLRLGHSSPVSGNVILMLDCLSAHPSTRKVLRFILISVFVMGTVLSSGVPKLTKSTFDGRGCALKHWLLRSSVKVEVRAKTQGQSCSTLFFFLLPSNCQRCKLLLMPHSSVNFASSSRLQSKQRFPCFSSPVKLIFLVTQWHIFNKSGEILCYPEHSSPSACTQQHSVLECGTSGSTSYHLSLLLSPQTPQAISWGDSSATSANKDSAEFSPQHIFRHFRCLKHISKVCQNFRPGHTSYQAFLC